MTKRCVIVPAMAADFIGELLFEFILRPILEITLQLLGYLTGYFLLPLISFGKIRVAPAQAGVTVIPKWHGFNKSSDGNIILHEEMGALFGIVFWLLTGIGIYFLF